MIDIKTVREEMSKLHAEASTIVDASKDRELTTEEVTAQDERFSKLDKLQKQLADAEKLATYSFEQATPAVAKPKKSADQVAVEQFESKRHVATAANTIVREDFGKALAEWTLTGTMPEQFATITSATSSGALFPKQVGLPVLANSGSALRDALAIVGVQPVTTDSTAELNLPVIAIGVGSDVSETAVAGTDNTPVPPVINLKPTPTQSGQAWVSNLELGSLDYDLTAEIVPALIDAKEMRLEQKTFAAMIADTTITQVVATDSISTFTYENLVDLNRKLSRRYDRLKVIFLSDAAYAFAEKLKGSDGQPILNRDTQNQTLLRFNGTPVIRASYCEAFGANKFVGFIVSFVGFKVRDAGQPKLIRHVDDKDKVDQTGLNYIGYHAVGYVPSAVAALKCPAS